MDLEQLIHRRIPPADRQPRLVRVVDDPEGAYARLTAAPVTRSILQQLLATRSSVLDRTRLSTTRAESAEVVDLPDAGSPWVTAWPRTARADSATERTVPDVAGATLRDAARQLHNAGLRVRIEGWGTVEGTDPTAGTAVPAGTVVQVTAHRPAPR